MRDISGGCLCGQVRYSAHSDPAFMGVCHCKNYFVIAHSIGVPSPPPVINFRRAHPRPETN